MALRPGEADSRGILFVGLGGRWRIDQGLPEAEVLRDKLDASVRQVSFDAGELTEWDSGLLSFVAGIYKACAERGIAVDGGGLPPGAQRLLAMARAIPEQKVSGRSTGTPGLFAQAGIATLEFVRGVPQMLGFLGEVTLSLLRLVSGRARFRARDLWLEIEEVGPRALPIVSVISFLVGLILAYLGADQLKLVGAQIFIADLVAIGMVREVGALMTGIIIAGRTGAAFAAQLGTMQVNEEIDAYKALGISTIDFLVLPRMLALMLMVPLLTLYSGFIGMLAGLLVSVTIFDIGVFEYYTETLRALEFKQFAVGLSKGTVYGAMIAFAGCLRGMQCGRSAEAVGHAATSAVVTAILLITIAASIMTIVYYQLGI
ncbi:MAG: ABC transporter permease [Sterolibacteriaceae bacterium]|uniref:MlaE family ABC transporter permease n=1 Tax=Sulfuritalea sp. TaxID=2480090 RepID=UPI001A3D0AE6|nr:ABC transporter permease [Sulfuritalea sp.]MBL8480137.1 ABC transporter permease [Sterolibacteriaceae bacterium]MBN8473430.1 ABC transporter permease [Sulfuritalea sp.]